MIHSTLNKSPLQIAVNDYFTAFKTDILKLTSLQWKEEDLKGNSFSQWKVMQYYNLMYLLGIIFEDVNRTKDLNYPWSYYETKYNLSAVEKCITCEDIDYGKAVTAFNLPESSNEGGIELMGLELNFIIGDAIPLVSNILIKELIDTPSACKNFIEEEMVPNGYISLVNFSDFDTVQDIGPDTGNELIDS